MMRIFFLFLFTISMVLKVYSGNLIDNKIDSIKYYTLGELFVTDITSKNDFSYLINSKQVIPKVIVNDSLTENKLNQIAQTINNAEVINHFDYNTTERTKLLQIYESNAKFKYNWLLLPEKGIVRGCAIIYTKDERILIWFGLCNLDIHNLRLNIENFEYLLSK